VMPGEMNLGAYVGNTHISGLAEGPVGLKAQQRVATLEATVKSALLAIEHCTDYDSACEVAREILKAGLQDK
jgi:hypothetical protein